MNEREITDGLRQLVRTDWPLPPGGAARAARTGRRRFGTRVAGTAALVGALVVAVPVAVGLGGTSAAPLPPATPAVSPAPAGPTPEPSAPAPVVEGPGPAVPAVPTAATADPPAAATPSLPAPGPVAPATPLAVEDRGDEPVRAGTLAGLTVARHQPGADPDLGALRSSGTTWAVDGCGDGASVTDVTRTGWFASSEASPSGDSSVLEQAATYADAASARAALADLVSEVERCQPRRAVVWQLWDGSPSEGSVRLVAYGLGEGFYGEGATADPQPGEVYRLQVDGSAVVLTGRASAYGGTAIAYALGDTGVRVGPADWGDREAVDADLALVDRLRTGLAGDVSRHLAGDGTGSPGYPPAVEASQGGRYQAVVAAVVREPGDARVGQAEQDLRAAGYAPLVGDVECFQGAREALGLDPARQYTVVAVTFGSAEDARRMVDLYPPGVVGTVEVTSTCLD